MHTPSIADRVLFEAQKHHPRFTVMNILFAMNKQHPYPMVDLRQVHHALDHMARDGKFTKISAGVYMWKE